ncbi:uncharacterized protein LOC115769478 [Drosophila novamexicana]|uniref:uncharacterized protein LOC115769478 n=1 Tax=Drosophila novamexicana TaxID=47314 RepID=UPI0011E59D10|nr:uncharacterized protein LOC115769478 [Drosophila novamexicana]
MNPRLAQKFLLMRLLSMLCLTLDCQAMLFRTSRAECKSLDLAFCYFKSCEMWSKNGRTKINFFVAVRYKEPVDDITINLALYRITKTYRMPIINETIDYCAFSSQSFASRLFNYAVLPVFKNSNMNFSCPFQPDVIVNGTVSDNSLITEIPAPKGNYIFNFRLAAFKKWKVDIKIYSKVVNNV